ncbi:MAG: hypothetical protein E7571_02000 [Ruminococcaceae bacterium]|nr:hypothetical protein [Oscillospiraceae bacterium]
MKIFKNRGDIYIPKSDYKSSGETRFLRITLVLIVLFTAAFVVILSRQYSSAKDFFGRGEVSVTQETVTNVALPEIEGKTNFLIFETDTEQTVIHYIYLFQADRDNKAYKVCTLSPDTVIDNNSIYDIYSSGGGASLQTKLTEYLGIQIDYYAAFDSTSFSDFCSKLGTFVYPNDEELKYSTDLEEDNYTIHLRKGDQTLDSQTFSNLLRYYSNQEKNYNKANNAVLYAFTSLINEENYEDAEALFRLFVKSSSTNITVRNFENGRDGLIVFSKLGSKVPVYSTQIEYEGNTLTQNSVENIKGYFNK